MRIARVLLALTLLCAALCAAALDDQTARAFLAALAEDAGDPASFLDPDDAAFAGRLGIAYPEAPVKPLIARGLTGEQRDLLRARGRAGSYAIETLAERHARLVLFPGDAAHTESWVFRDGRLVSDILYHTRDWRRETSEFFRFRVSDPALFHPANIATLESALLAIADLLAFTPADLALLRREKIVYCFCADEDEIEQLTGYAARGMYILSHDIIVSTWSAHVHELAHLLINFKLKTPHLFTHPLPLEGFAVAAGGRGGKSPAILHQLGLFLHRSGWIAPAELLSCADFRNANASVTYPAAGAYNRFLLENLGAAAYLRLYRDCGGDAVAVAEMEIPAAALPPADAWREWLATRPAADRVAPGCPALAAADAPVVARPLPDGRLGFAVPGLLLFGRCGEDADADEDAAYRSLLFAEFGEGLPYAGERYLVRASDMEVGVYDLFTNTLIAHYAAGFADKPRPVPQSSGLYLFTMSADPVVRDAARASGF